MLNLGTLFATIKIFDEMSPEVKKAGFQLSALGQGLTQTGFLLSGFSVAIGGAAKEAIELGTQFEHTTAKLVALANVSQQELGAVRQHLLDLAPAIGIGPNELAKAMYTVSSTMGDTKIAMEVLDVAAKGTAIGMGKTTSVAGALVAIINSYGKENITAAEAGDILTETIREGGAEAEELAPRLAKVTPFAAQLGVSFEEVGANLATMTKLGVPASQAVTSLSAIFAALARAVPRGQKALAEVGMTYASLRAEIREKGLTESLIKLRETFKNNEEGLIDVVGRLEALKDVLGTTGPMAETYRNVLIRIKESQGVLTESTKTMAETQEFKWNQLKASIEKFWIALGSALLPVLKTVVDMLNGFLPYLEKLVHWFDLLPTPVKGLTVALVALVAAVGPLLIIFGQMALGLGFLIRGFGLFTGAAAAAKVATTGLTVTSTALVVGSRALVSGWTAFLIPFRMVIALMQSYGVTAGLAAASTGLWGVATGKVVLTTGEAVPALTRFGAALASIAAGIGKTTIAILASPITWWVVGIAAVTYGLSKLLVQEKLNHEQILQNSKATLDEANALEDLRVEILDVALQQKDLVPQYEKLIKIAPEHIRLISDERITYEELSGAVHGLIKAKQDLQLVDLKGLEASRIVADKELASFRRQLSAVRAQMGTPNTLGGQFGQQTVDKSPEELVALRQKAQELQIQIDATTETLKLYDEQILAVKESLDKNLQAHNEADRATKFFNATLADMGKNLKLPEKSLESFKAATLKFNHGLELAKISSTELVTALKTQAGIQKVVAEVTRALAEEAENEARVSAEARQEAQKRAKEADEQARKYSGAEQTAEVEKMTATWLRLGKGVNMSAQELHTMLKQLAEWKSQGQEIANKELDAQVTQFDQNKKTWDAMIEGIIRFNKEREDLRKRYEKDEKDTQDRIKTWNAETAAILAKINGDSFQKKRILLENDVRQEMDKLNSSKLSVWQYLNAVIALHQWAAAQKSQINQDESIAYQKFLDKALENERKQMDILEKIRERHNGVMSRGLMAEFTNRISAAKEAARKEQQQARAAYGDTMAHLKEHGLQYVNEIKDREANALKAYKEAVEKSKATLKQQLDMIKVELVMAYISLGFAAYDALKNINAATKGIENSTEAMVKGARAGFEAGKVLGVYGQIIGTVMGAVLGFLNAEEARQKARQKEINGIREVVKELGDLVGSLSMTSAYTKALGLSTINFSMNLQQAQWVAEEFKRRLGKLKDEMSDLKDQVFMASAELRAFRDALPTEPIVMEFVLRQVQNAGDSTISMLASMQKSVDAFADRQVKAIEAAMEGTTGAVREQFERELAYWKSAASRIINLTAGGAAAAANILLASYDGTTESLRKMKPALDTLTAAMKKNGFEGSAAFNTLVRLANIATDEVSGPLVDAIDSGTRALVSMYNSGFLTQEVFSGMVDQVMANRKALIDAGASEEDVNRILQPSLQRIWELRKDGHFEVDATTAALLEQAEANGTVGDRFRSATDRMVIALERLADMFQTVFADKLAEAARAGAREAQRELDGIRVPNFTRRPGKNYTDDETGNDSDLPGFATGTRGQFLDFGAGTNVVLHGRERIMTEGEAASIPGTGEQTIVVQLDGEVIVRKVVHGMPRYLKLIGAQ